MKIFERHYRFPTILLFLSAVILTGCLDGDGESTAANDAQISSVLSVSSVSPADGATGVGTNTKVVAAFDGAVEASTIDTFSFVVGVPGQTSLPGTVVFHEATNTAIFTPADGNDFSSGSNYRATITTGVKDQAGRRLANAFVWDFATGSGADNTAPTVISTKPIDAATGVRRDRTIVATFSEALDPTTMNGDNFYLTDATGTRIAGVVSYMPGTNTAFLNPPDNLAANHEYTVTLTNAVKDTTRAGNSFLGMVWSFTTGAEVIAPVDLGTAGDYVILAMSGISTTGTTAITGDIGVSPAAESYITGFSQSRDSTNQFATSAIVTGKIFAADMAVPTPANLTTAVGDMETAYTDAAGRSNPDESNLGAGNISGMTLTSGLYNWGTGLAINTDVTLSGDSNDVWIFQIAQDLTVGNGVTVTLTGGALPKNVFWQVAESVTLGTTADFKGIILSKTKIEIKTGAVLHGRAMAQTAVTLDANAVTEPAE